MYFKIGAQVSGHDQRHKLPRIPEPLKPSRRESALIGEDSRSYDSGLRFKLKT